MRVIDCECGHTVSAANDDELVEQVKGHLSGEHPDKEMGEDELRSFVTSNAYDAEDS